MLHFRRVHFDLGADISEIGMVELTTPERVLEETLALAGILGRGPETRVSTIGLIVPWHAADPRFSGQFPDTLAAALAGKAGLPLRRITSARALALHDAYAGSARQMNHFITLHIHETVGLGIFLNGGLHDPPPGNTAGGTLAAWRLSTGEKADDCLGRPAINRQVEKMGFRVEHHETYRVLQQALAKAPDDCPASQLAAGLAGSAASLIANLSIAFEPERIFLYSPLNEMETAFRVPLGAALESLGSGQLASSVELADDWKAAMARGAAKAAFDLWLSTPARRSGPLEGSEDPTRKD
jgi:predicted NBD/HSP70 family sugar kinase